MKLAWHLLKFSNLCLELQDLPRYYNIIRCDGMVEVKLHEEDLTILQQNLDRKMKEIDCLKKELQRKQEQLSQVEQSLLEKQDDEVAYDYTDGAENSVLEKHQNDHLKARFQMEKIDHQSQLTKALLQKKDIESKLDVAKHGLELSEKTCRRAQELFQKSSTRSLMPSVSRTTTSDILVNKIATISHCAKPVSSNNSCDVQLDTHNSAAALDVHHKNTESPYLVPVSAKKSATAWSPSQTHQLSNRTRVKRLSESSNSAEG